MDNPSIQDRLHEEVKASLGPSGTLKKNAFDSLPYLKVPPPYSYPIYNPDYNIPHFEEMLACSDKNVSMQQTLIQAVIKETLRFGSPASANARYYHVITLNCL